MKEMHEFRSLLTLCDVCACNRNSDENSQLSSENIIILRVEKMSLRELLDFATQFLVMVTCLKILQAADWVLCLVVSIYVGVLIVILLVEEEE